MLPLNSFIASVEPAQRDFLQENGAPTDLLVWVDQGAAADCGVCACGSARCRVPRTVIELISERPADFRWTALEHPELYGDGLWREFARYLDVASTAGAFTAVDAMIRLDDVVVVLATRANADNGLLDYLGTFFEYGDGDVRCAVAANPACPESVREAIMRSDDEYAKAALLGTEAQS